MHINNTIILIFFWKLHKGFASIYDPDGHQLSCFILLHQLKLSKLHAISETEADIIQTPYMKGQTECARVINLLLPSSSLFISLFEHFSS